MRSRRRRQNADDNLRELERRYAASQAADDWTALAVARQRAGLQWPEPPQSWAPGFRFQTHAEIEEILRLAYDGRWSPENRVEAVFQPDWGMLLGKVWDWPPENVPLGLPAWTKIRFRVGRSFTVGHQQPRWLVLANTRSRGGYALGKDLSKEFAYVRII